MGEPLRSGAYLANLIAPPAPRMVVVEPGDPLRASFEALVEARFAACFDAHVRRHYRRLVGLVGQDGRPRAVAGVRFADDEPLFLEAYLDRPVEELALPRARRSQIVEIGSLASEGPCAAVTLFHRLARWLREEQGREVAVGALTPKLERLLFGAGFELTRLADADPERLGASRRDWGGYYDSRPAVFCGLIPSASKPTTAQVRRFGR